MDPDANWYEQIRLKALIKAGDATSYDRAELRELRAALREWLASGGFPPKKAKSVKAIPAASGGPVKVINQHTGAVILSLPEGTTNAQAMRALVKHNGCRTVAQMSRLCGGLAHIGIERPSAMGTRRFGPDGRPL
jgi:hypothetical protein